MKALRLHKRHDLRLHDEPRPEPGPGEALLRVTAAGICASDLHWYSQGNIGDASLSRPLVLGHEFAAVVAQDTPDFPAGTRVAVDPAVHCRQCAYCERGDPNLCPHHTFSGHGRTDGAFREYMAWPTSAFHPLPASLSHVDGAMLEPLGVAIHAVDLGHLRAGMTVAVLGCGPIGLLTLQVARLAGATRVVASDEHDHRMEMARALGADTVLAARAGDETADMVKACGGDGADVVFEAAGENEAVETAMAVVRPGGRVVLIGIPDDDRTSFRASVARRKGLTMAMVRRMKHTYPRAIHLVAGGLVDVRSLVSHRFSLPAYQRAFDTAEARAGIKVVLEPGGSADDSGARA